MKPRSLGRLSFLCLITCIVLAIWLVPQKWSLSSLASPNLPYVLDHGDPNPGMPTGGPDDDDEADTKPPPDDTGSPVGSLSLTSWTPIGPAPIGNGNVPGGRPATGRCGQVVSHPTDANTLYLASVGGGIWKTVDGGTSWTPLTDNQATLWGYAVAVSASDPNTIYAGTGEPTNSISSFYGRGVLKSTDAGATWTLMGNSDFNRLSIARVVIHPTDPNTVYVATGGGVNGLSSNHAVWKTIDGGVTWTNTSNSITSHLTGNMSDLLMHPTDPNTLYMAVGDYSGFINNSVYKTTNGGGTWAVAGNHPKGITNGVISIAISRSNPLVLYSTTSSPSTFGLLRIMKTIDGGTTWTNITGTTPNYMGGQGWYDQDIAVDPTNPDVVYVGGQTGLLKSENGGTSWTSIASGTDGHGPHVDHHGMAFDANNKLMEVNDGGIWRLTDPTLSSLTWSDLNGNLQISQFIGIATHATNPSLAYGGTQDNGSIKFVGDTGWITIRGGDGGYFRCDPATPSTLYHTFFYPAAPAFLERSDDGGNTWTGKISGINTGDGGNFYVPYMIDPSNPTRLLLGTTRVYETTNRGDSWTPISTPGTNGWGGAASIDSLSAAPTDVNTIYVAAGAAIYVTFDHGATWNLRNSGTSADHFHDILVDPTDKLTAYVVRDRFGAGAHVYKTTNGGVNWTNISGNLPDIPCQSIALDINNPGQADDVLYVGTDTGVYRSRDGGATWTVYATGMPNVSVFNMDLNRNLGILMAGTHGRGAFEILVPLIAVSNASTVCGLPYNSAVPAFNGAPPVTWTLISGPAGMTIDSATGAVSWPVPVASLTPYSISIQATDTNGEFAGKTWKLTVRPGDFNGDGIADSTTDLPIFVNHLLGVDNSLPCAADTNFDGFVDGLDAQGWVISSLTP